MLRVIRELRPTWVVGENVVGLIKLGLDEVLTDLEGEGYATRTFNIPACSIGAPHLRQRIWVVAHADSESEPDGTFDGNAGQRQLGFEFVADPDDDGGQERHAQRPEQDRQGQTGDAVSRGSSVSNSKRPRTGVEEHQGGGQERESADTHQSEVLRQGNGTDSSEGFAASGGRPEEWWEFEPAVGRLVDGLPNRVSQLRALGNSIVPQIAQEIGQAIRVAHDH